MPLKFRKKVILAKIEATYGTDATPTGAANAIQVSDVTIRPVEGDNASRALVRDTLGAEPAIPVGVHVAVEFAVEIAGSGAVDQAPAYGPLLRGCGMAETITPTTGPVEYDPVSSGEESLSIYFNNDGNRHRLMGARGNVVLEFPANGVPRYRFRFVGLWTAPDASALPTPTLTAFQAPLPVNNANSPTFSLHGYAAVMQTLSIDLGVDAGHRDLVNGENVLIRDRRSSGSVTIEAPAIATKDFYGAIKGATLDTLQLIHGTTAGNIVQIDAPKVQLQSPSESESDGITMLQMGLLLTPDAGDDEVKITVK